MENADDVETVRGPDDGLRDCARFARLAGRAGRDADGQPEGVIDAGSLLAQMDLSVDPGKDFFRYATGGWQDRTEIPADEAAYGITQELHDLTIEQLLALLERLETSDELAVGSDQWKAVQLFAQAMDMRTRNAAGIAPIAAELEAIDAIASLDELYAFVREGVPDELRLRLLRHQRRRQTSPTARSTPPGTAVRPSACPTATITGPTTKGTSRSARRTAR